MQNIMNNVDNIESDTKIAQRLITGFAKRLYTDKLIMCFILIIVLLIIIIVLAKYKVIKW